MARSLLLAEDSPTIQKAVALSLGHEQYEITNVGSADECIAKAKTLRPDVVLIDHALPSDGATRVLEALRQDDASKDAKLVVLSGSSEPFDEAKARQAGADEIIAKPFDSQVLIDKLAALFGAAPDKAAEPTRVAAPPASRPGGQPLTMNAPWPGFGKGAPGPGGPTTVPGMQASPSTTPNMPASAPQAAASPPWAPPRPATGTPPAAVPPAAPLATPAKAPAPFAPPAAAPLAPATPPVVSAPRPAPFGAPPTLGAPSPVTPIVGPPNMGPTQTLAAFPALGRLGGATASSPTMPAMPAAGGPAPMAPPIARVPEAKPAPAPWTAPAAPAVTQPAAPALAPAVAPASPAAQAPRPVAAPVVVAASAPGGGGAESAVRTFLKDNPAVFADVVRGYLNENRAVLEEAIWEIVPDLAETLIREELDRLLRDKAGGK